MCLMILLVFTSIQEAYCIISPLRQMCCFILVRFVCKLNAQIETRPALDCSCRSILFDAVRLTNNLH